jgi:hypothetical protein
MTDENDIGQILVLDDADDVLNMRVEIDLTAELRRCLRSPMPVSVGT